MIHTIKKHKSILLCPGPVLLSKRVKKAVLKTNIGHREPEFSVVLQESRAMIKPIVGIKSHDKSYQVAFITGSGTAANETVLSSIGALGPVLVVSNGEFGERLYDVAKLHNKDVSQVKFKWQSKIDLKKVETALKNKKINLVAMVHHETSTGLLNPVGKVAALAHKYGALITVDCISSIGAEVIEAKKWDVDVIVGASGKALSAMPGVGILIVKDKVVPKLDGYVNPIHYLDLNKHLTYMRDHVQTPNTPAVHVFVSLHASLKEITKMGLEKFQGIIEDRTAYVRKSLQGMGLEYIDYRGENSRVITCVTLPKFISFDYLASRLKSKGIIVYNGKGVLKDRIFQVGHIGALNKSDTKYAVAQIRQIIKRIPLGESESERDTPIKETVPHVA